MDNHQNKKPIRVGVYSTIAEADRVVGDLLVAGFRKEELAVLCSDKYKEQFFRDVPTPQPSGSHTVAGVLTGGGGGAAIGGMMLAASAIVTGGASLLVAGAALVGAGALAGSFTGAMAARGMESDLADYYDQAIRQGKILVAVDLHDAPDAQRLERAEEILGETGRNPVSLKRG